jgi:L-threonylcarbamoyladenylate synthase
LPTETVYGLAADARNPDAVRRVFALKGRPADHPLIVHLPSTQFLGPFARDISDAAWMLAEHFWPGPLTLVLKREFDVPREVTGGQDTIAVRVPAHPVAQAVLQAFDGGLAAPSANRFGRISPTTAVHVRAEFGEDELPIILDGGPCEIGIESTIVDCSAGTPRILRPGMIDRSAIEDVIGNLADAGPSAPRVPGALEKHYAPRTPLVLLPRGALGDGPGRARVLALGGLPLGLPGLALPPDPARYARGLYAALRSLDAARVDEIRVEQLPAGADWDAIRDRLNRAAAGSG